MEDLLGAPLNHIQSNFSGLQQVGGFGAPVSAAGGLLFLTSNVAVSGPCGVMHTWRLTPPGTNPVALACAEGEARGYSKISPPQ